MPARLVPGTGQGIGGWKKGNVTAATPKLLKLINSTGYCYGEGKLPVTREQEDAFAQYQLYNIASLDIPPRDLNPPGESTGKSKKSPKLLVGAAQEVQGAPGCEP